VYLSHDQGSTKILVDELFRLKTSTSATWKQFSERDRSEALLSYAKLTTGRGRAAGGGAATQCHIAVAAPTAKWASGRPGPALGRETRRKQSELRQPAGRRPLILMPPLTVLLLGAALPTGWRQAGASSGCKEASTVYMRSSRTAVVALASGWSCLDDAHTTQRSCNFIQDYEADDAPQQLLDQVDTDTDGAIGPVEALAFGVGARHFAYYGTAPNCAAFVWMVASHGDCYCSHVHACDVYA
jgi:hypothetical protein